MEFNVFDRCSQVNDLLASGNELTARDELIKVLDYCEAYDLPYPPILNHLIRQTGLYPYLKPEDSDWQERFIYEAFRVDVGAGKFATLHREQSALLRALVEGKSLAISAPTSFGKSFVIDSFIVLRNPRNVVIIVPTIALADETRRRLQKKFSNTYRIITTADVELADRNIFIFPQERAIGYVDKIIDLDMLIIDEFYKASPKFDKERSSSLLRAILKLSERAKQRYFLAPNISSLNHSTFTKGMDFLKFEFNTVFLEKKELYKELNNDEVKKSACLLKILTESKTKTLIYAGSYAQIDKVANLIIDGMPPVQSYLLIAFDHWLSKHYDKNWHLTSLVKRGTGIHNGQLHRSLSQIQIRLFEEQNGLTNIVSTSSIVEGVNTCAENVIIWRNKNGSSKLNDFTYKNIIGRGGRMFRHFIGKIYILESPPAEEHATLELQMPDDLLGTLDEEKYEQDLTPTQISKIIDYKQEMARLLGETDVSFLAEGNSFQSSDTYLLKRIATEIFSDPTAWNGLGFLNSTNPNDWDRLLYKVIGLVPGGWDIEYSRFVEFIKVLSQNWLLTIPELLRALDRVDIGIDQFFKLERNVVFKFSSLLSDVNVLQSKILKGKHYDVSSFAARLSFAFLPPAVYQLEEYGLPRMISRKIHQAKLIDFEDSTLNLHRALEILREIGLVAIKEATPGLDKFDIYILDYFFDGITVDAA